MVFSMGSIQSYVKAQGMRFKWEQKKKDPSLMTQPSSSGCVSSLYKAKACYNVDIITQRMNMGKRLTSGEMSFLRQNHPELYSKAVRIAAEREAYEQTLKKCKTKEEVRMANMQRCQAFAAEVNEARKNGNGEDCLEVGQRAAAIRDTHVNFTGTKAYKSLPENWEEAERRKKGKGRRERVDAWDNQPPKEGLIYYAYARKQSGWGCDNLPVSFAAAKLAGEAETAKAETESDLADSTAEQGNPVAVDAKNIDKITTK